uniref:Dolichyl-diphosphooligosaccharide-protein glycosyltransferase subunit TMEM258 n=1 Tax=Schistosoma japonicum TaxID=6182 RepID=C1LLK7_SCHJA|nr:Protein NEF1 [Schistosoma japonicum]
MDITLDQMGRYVPPINPGAYPILAFLFLAIGTFFVAWFSVYELTANKFSRVLLKEFLLSLVASVFLGFGTLFLLLCVGIYV